MGVKAIDPETGKTMWQFPILQGSNSNGVLATGGNLVFASVRDGNLIALDSKTGTYLWHYQTGSQHAASAMSYAVDGTQYGVKALQLATEGRWGQMVSKRGETFTSVSIEEAVQNLRRVDPRGPEVQAARAVGTHFGD